MPRFLTLDDLDAKGKRVLVRADLNVPVKDGRVIDQTRISRLAPTIRELAEKGARVVVISHFGRPKGKPDPALSLKPIAQPLSEALGRRHVAFAEDCIGPRAKAAVDGLKPGEIALLENLRFHKEEESNDKVFAKALASLADVYVDDAFSCAHRAHASVEAVAHLLPAYAGRLMEAELKALSAALEHPQHPVAAIVGGAKVSTKLAMLHFLAAKVQFLIIGGAMANTLLLAEGRGVGKSLVERDLLDEARRLRGEAEQTSCELILPVDAVVAKELKPGVAVQTVSIGQVPEDSMILDIGPRTTALIAEKLASCRTLVWNGPLGAFETKPFDQGTTAVALRAADLTQEGKLLSVAGGGDTVAALKAASVKGKLTYVSAAGGAFLEWLEGRDLPGIQALKR
ncbi:MAG TPA: phosphoglycerate kinase [Stellaceae bacterium]|nr:phosphoglycerate kinase [Stellaceae bacterium]